MRLANSRSLLLVSVLSALVLLIAGTAVTVRALGRIGAIENTSRDLDDRELRFTSRFRSQIFSLQSLALKAQLRRDGHLNDEFSAQLEQVRLFLDERRSLFTQEEEKLRYAQLTERLHQYGEQLSEQVDEAALSSAGTPQERALALRESLAAVNEKLSLAYGDSQIINARLCLQQVYSAAVVAAFDPRDNPRKDLTSAIAEAERLFTKEAFLRRTGSQGDGVRIQELGTEFINLAKAEFHISSDPSSGDPRIQLERYEALGETRDGLTELATQLGDARREAFQAKLGRYRASAESLRWLMASLFGLLGLALAGAASLVYQAYVLPMKGRLSSAEESVRQHENLVTLGSLAAGLAHEIRNPLTAIKARLFALSELITNSPPAENQARVISGEINRLETTVQEFLDYAKPKEPHLLITPLQPYLEDFRTLVLPEMKDLGIHFSLGNATSLRVKIDREQILQILLNLIRNAAEATSSEGVIVVSASTDLTGNVHICVTDNGPGILTEHRSKIFEPFFSNKKGGTGLGLPISRNIARAHQGDLVFESSADKGTTFRLLLPDAT